MERTIPGDLPEPSRRDFVRKAAYVAPAILTLVAAPAFAKTGSDKKPKDPQDPKDPKDLKQPKMRELPLS